MATRFPLPGSSSGEGLPVDGAGASPSAGLGDVLRRVLSRLGVGGGNGAGGKRVTPAGAAGPGVTAPRVPRGGVGATEPREPESWNGGDDERKLVAYILHCYRMAADARRTQEGRYLTNYAYYRDRQYEFYNEDLGSMTHWRTRDPNPYRSWDVHNKIKPKLRSLVARTHSSNLETLITAMSEAPEDKEYAAAQRAVQDDVASSSNMDRQNLDLIHGFTVIGPQFRKTWVDWDGEVLRPLLAEDGESVGGAVAERSGRICKGIFGWEEAYPDPRGSTSDQWQWFIHGQSLTLDEIIEQFPERGGMVSAHSGSDGYRDDSARNRLDIINNNTQRARQGYDTLTVREFWHKPCATWPEGVTAWECEGVLLWSGPWLYPSLKELPFVPYVYERAYQTPWADAATDSVRGAQDHYNEAMNAVVDAAKEGPKLLLPTNAGVKTDAFRRGKPREVIPYDQTMAQAGHFHYLNHPSLPESVRDVLTISDRDIGEILGVDPVSEGRVPGGIQAASAIQSLEEFNKASSSLTIEAYRQSLLADALITEQLSRDLYRGKALLTSRESSDTTSDEGADVGAMQELLAAIGATSGEYAEALAAMPAQKRDEVKSRVINLDALQNGRAVIDVRASAPKSATQRQQELLDMARTGMFAAEALDVTIPLLEMMQIEDYDKLRSQLLRVLMARQSKMAQAQEAAQKASESAMQMEAAKTEQASHDKVVEQQARASDTKMRLDADMEKARLQASTQIQIALINAQKAENGSEYAGSGGEYPAYGADESEVDSLFAPQNSPPIYDFSGEAMEDEDEDVPDPFSEESYEAISRMFDVASPQPPSGGEQGGYSLPLQQMGLPSRSAQMPQPQMPQEQMPQEQMMPPEEMEGMEQEMPMPEEQMPGGEY